MSGSRGEGKGGITFSSEAFQRESNETLHSYKEEKVTTF